MDLLDVARTNELVHTNSQSCGSSSHVNPLPTPTTPEQVAIEEQATSILRNGIAPDIQRHLIAGFLPVEDEVDDLNKLHQTLLSINQEIRASGVPLTDIDRLLGAQCVVQTHGERNCSTNPSVEDAHVNCSDVYDLRI
jgi:hypothetical protein